MSLKITVREHGFTMSHDCADEQKIRERWTYAREQVLGLRELYQTQVLHKGSNHLLRLLHDGEHMPEPDCGGPFAPEIIDQIERLFQALDLAGKGNDAPLNDFLGALKDEHKIAYSGILETFIMEITNPETLQPDSRTLFDYGEQVIQNVEGQFDSQKDRIMDHEWHFTNSGKVLRYSKS